MELPPCEISRLEEVAEIVKEACKKDKNTALAMEQDNYIPKLLEIFHKCEDLEDKESLYQLHDIFINLFFMNHHSIITIMLREDLIMDVIGCLEYDPTRQERIHHREFVQNQARFQEVIPIQNPDIVSKIHLLYKVLYIQEVILPTPSVFEVKAALKSFVLFIKVGIVMGLQVCAIN